MTQQALQFSELEPCKHCGGEGMEQWRLVEDWKGDEYVTVVIMCRRCTFETDTGPDMRNRFRAVEYWNAGVPTHLATARRLLSFEENWHFHTEYMRCQRPTLREAA